MVDFLKKNHYYDYYDYCQLLVIINDLFFQKNDYYDYY